MIDLTIMIDITTFLPVLLFPLFLSAILFYHITGVGIWHKTNSYWTPLLDLSSKLFQHILNCLLVIINLYKNEQFILYLLRQKLSQAISY